MRLSSFSTFVGLALLGAGCPTIKTEHHITLDHNITIRIEKEVNSFLDDLYGEVEGESGETPAIENNQTTD
tara:strand:+ start:677 stop:889 length:213 start_codon:yes stop_codon:yes gene_type:complete